MKGKLAFLKKHHRLIIILGVLFAVLAGLICYRIFGIESIRIAYNARENAEAPFYVVDADCYQEFGSSTVGCQVIHDASSASAVIEGLRSAAPPEHSPQASYEEIEKLYPFAYLEDPEDQETRSFLEERYYENHSLICLDLRETACPIYEANLVYAVFINGTAHLFIDHYRDGSTADNPGVLYCIGAPQNIQTVKIYFFNFLWHTYTLKIQAE